MPSTTAPICLNRSWKCYKYLRDVSLTLFGGEVVGVVGLAGSGRSELLRALAGADPLSAGWLELAGTRTHLRSSAQAWRRGVALVPEERRSQGLVMSASVRANTVLPHLGALSRWGFASRRREATLSKQLASRTKLKARSLEERVHRLSGGNQQKVVLAKALASSPRVLLLDEPTRGVDVGAKHDLYSLILEAAAGGAGVLLASSDLLEVLGLCSRVLVLQGGRLVHDTAAAGLNQADLLTLCHPAEAA